MIFDIHVHIIGLESGRNGNYLCPPRRRSFFLRRLLRPWLAGLCPAADDPEGDPIRSAMRRWAGESRVDRAVLLALDGVHRRDGAADLDRTMLIVGNDYVAGVASGHPKLLWGASVHPYRKDALDELDRAAAAGACLVKWLPSAQGIDPADPLCIPFYDRMAALRMPLLCHTGVEHTLARFSHALNDPHRLETALRRGVTVIAAHCGTRTFLYERSRFAQWEALARRHPNCHGDLSAFCLPLHGRELRRILGDPVLLSKVVYGSDFPIPAMPLWHVGRLGWRKVEELRAVRNPLDKVCLTMKALGVPDEAFSRAASLLRLPEEVAA